MITQAILAFYAKLGYNIKYVIFTQIGCSPTIHTVQEERGLSMEVNHQEYYAPFEAILAEYRGEPSQLIPLLQKLQGAYGYLPQDIIVRLSERTGIKVPEILGVATFYSQFRLTPMGKHVIKLCHGTACHVNGADNIGAALCDELGIGLDETTEDGLFTIETVACLGCCSLAPVMMVDGEVHGRLTQDKARKVIREIKKQEVSAQ